jgi:hypothetical protein
MSGRTRTCSLLQSVQIICSYHRVPHKMDSCFSEAKRSGLEAEDLPLPPSITEVKNVWTYTSTPPRVFMVWCLIQNSYNLTYSTVYKDGRDSCQLTGNCLVIDPLFIDYNAVLRRRLLAVALISVDELQMRKLITKDVMSL